MDNDNNVVPFTLNHNDEVQVADNEIKIGCSPDTPGDQRVWRIFMSLTWHKQLLASLNAKPKAKLMITYDKKTKLLRVEPDAEWGSGYIKYPTGTAGLLRQTKAMGILGDPGVDYEATKLPGDCVKLDTSNPQHRFLTINLSKVKLNVKTKTLKKPRKPKLAKAQPEPLVEDLAPEPQGKVYHLGPKEHRQKLAFERKHIKALKTQLEDAVANSEGRYRLIEPIKIERGEYNYVPFEE
jgi:hypothetical protein